MHQINLCLHGLEHHFSSSKVFKVVVPAVAEKQRGDEMPRVWISVESLPHPVLDENLTT